MLSLLATDSQQGEVFELQSNNAGLVALRILRTVSHAEIIAPGVNFGAGTFTHVGADLSGLGVDDTWCSLCSFVTNDSGFDDCVIGQPHWDAGVADIHIYNFGAGFVTASPITLRCLAIKVA